MAENDLAAAFPDAFALTPGHSLVVPKRHIDNYFELTGPEQASVWSLVLTVQQQLQVKHEPAGYNLGINVGAAAGQTVWHVHVHVIPRYEGDVKDPRGGVRWVIPEKAPYWKLK